MTERLKLPKLLIENTNLILLLILSVLIAWGILGEKIPVNNGLGWDGFVFSKVIMNLDRTGQFNANPYVIQRTLPYMLVWATAKTFHFSLSPETILKSFLILNTLLIFTAFYYWTKICKILKLRSRIKLLTFVGIFLNYGVLKMAWYSPALTDIMAFQLGMMSYYYYLKDDKYRLLFSILLGAFTFPTFILLGAIFFLFPYSTKIPLNKRVESLNWAFIILLLLIYGFLILLNLKIRPDLLNLAYTFGATKINYQVLPISIICTGAYLFLVSSSFKYLDLKKIVIRLKTRLTMLVIYIFFTGAIKVTAKLLADRPDSFGPKAFGISLLAQSLTNPLNYLLSHLLYFGPVFLFIFLSFKNFTNTIIRQGLGTFAFTILYLLLLIGNESRQFINALPVLMFLLGLSLNKKHLSYKLLTGLAIISLVYSRFWYQINRGEFTGQFQEFPMQHFFMSQGPWVSNKMYLILLGLVAFSCGVFYLIFRKDLHFLLTPENKKQLLTTPPSGPCTNPS